MISKSLVGKSNPLTALASWNPWSSLSLWDDDFFSGVPANMMKDFAVDVQENDKQYTVQANLPGFAEADINVSYDKNILTISASREECCENDNGYRLRERRYGSVSRSFSLPHVSADSIDATLKNGVLTITANKTTETQTKKIPIRSK